MHNIRLTLQDFKVILFLQLTKRSYMQDYIKSINYISQSLTDGEEIEVPQYTRLKLEEHHPSYADSTGDFCQTKYKYPYLPLYLGNYEIPEAENISINTLRLMIRKNSEHYPVYLPKELLVFKDFILENINYHRQFYTANKDCFIYITVRTATFEEVFYNNSKTWHIDGFQGSRIKRHVVEQDIFWCNKSPTEYLIQPMFCEYLHPSKHDINDFFEKNANENFKVVSKSNAIYLTTPYNIHRVNKNYFEGKRVFVRLNFSPVEIEDYTNTVNPMIPRHFSERRDVRDFLREYTIDEIKDSGFSF